MSRHGCNVAGGGRPGSPYQLVPQDSKPSVPKVLADRGGLRLQTADDRALSRSFDRVEPAAKQPATRCFSEGVTLRNSETSLLTPQTQQLSCPIHRQPRTVSTCHKTPRTEQLLASCRTAQRNSAVSKTRFSKKNRKKTFFGLYSRIS